MASHCASSISIRTLISVTLWAPALLMARVHAFSNNCSLVPISLPWTNVTLPDGIAMNRGIAIALGNQATSLRIATSFNNTRLRNARDCEFGNATVQSGCQGASGSSFDITSSTTWETAPEGDWNVTTVDSHESDETVIDGWDAAKFYGINAIPGFPLEVWSNAESDNKSGLALGPDSSFLTAILAAKAAPSAIWGLFFGSRSQTQGVDGNLTIGGFDKARVVGGWTNFTTLSNYLDAPCPLQVTIKDVLLNNTRGSFSLFADPDATVAACIDPLQNQFTFTQSMFDIFAHLTEHPANMSGAGGSNFTQQTYPLENEPLIGNLTVILSNGYTTVIPHYELVSQERGTDAQGKYAVINESRIMTAVGTTEDETVVPILGGTWLSQNYLLVDYDQNRFSLAPAVVGPMDDDAHDIVQVCRSATTTNTTTIPSAKSGAGHSSNVGAIAGGVVGGVAAVALAFVAFFRYRKQKKAHRPEVTPGNSPSLKERPLSEVEELRFRKAPEVYEPGAFAPAASFKIVGMHHQAGDRDSQAAELPSPN